MKKYTILLIIAGLAAIYGCSREGAVTNRINVASSVLPVFSASFENEAVKGYLDSCYQMCWNKGDTISVFTKSTFNWKYTFDGADGAREGTFSPEKIDGFIAATELEANANYAVYPHLLSFNSFTPYASYGDNTEYGNFNGTYIDPDGTIHVTLSTIQDYHKNAFDPKANVMVAATEGKENTSFTFKNLCGYLVVPVTGEGKVVSARFMGNDNEPLAGEVAVKASASTAPSIERFNYTQNVVWLSDMDVVLDDTPQNLWFVLPPVTFSAGFMVIFQYEDGSEVTVSTSRSRTIQRNVITFMEPVAVPKNEAKTLAVGEYTSWLFGKYSNVSLKYKASEDVYILEPLFDGRSITFKVVGDMEDDDGEWFYHFQLLEPVNTGLAYEDYVVTLYDGYTATGNTQYNANNYYYVDSGEVYLAALYYSNAQLGYKYDSFFPI